MKRVLNFFGVVLMAAAVASSCSDKKYETVKNDPLNTKIYTLDNGLKVFMSVNKAEPRIQTYIAVKVGSKNDPFETTGLAHYFEHLMFKGTQQFGTSDYEAEKPLLDQIEALFEEYRNCRDEEKRAEIYHRIDSISFEASKIAIPNEYDKLMACIGADGTNAWTSQDETVYTEDIPANQIDNWARIQADRFRNTVIRGFHTELETIYEEKNMSLTRDSRKVWESIDKLLFPNHPYGKQTTLGTQEHLKNPSITNVKKYHDTYYVPNNIAICVSGDFNPDEMVAAIEKYFGDWEPNPAIPTLQYESEEPITSPKVCDVYGLEAENIAIAWPYPGAQDLECAAAAEVAGCVISNGTAGLMDIDLAQQQKVLYAYAGPSTRPDYGYFISMAAPKEGQSLEELRDLVLGEIAKLRDGDFDESLLEAAVNNMKLAKMREIERNSSRAVQYVDAFISGIDWKDACASLDRISKVTREDVVAWAQKYLGAENYAIVYKRQGEDTTVQKISAPKITPIVTNRDMQSDFLVEIQNSVVKPIEPEYPDFKKDVTRIDLSSDADILYYRNTVNDIASVTFEFNEGSQSDPLLPLALTYLDYLGTPSMSAEQRASKMYSLACNFRLSARASRTLVSVEGLAENVMEALSCLQDLVQNAEGDEEVLTALKKDLMKERTDAKLSQRRCYSALSSYIVYGPEFIKNTTATNEEIMVVTSEELLSKVKNLLASTQEISYYGPEKASAFKSQLEAAYEIPSELRHVEKSIPEHLQTPSNSVVMAPYDSKQLYYMQYSDRGEKFTKEANPEISLYNEYFGGGMNTIVFQEMREARGLAYSAYAMLYTPAYLTDTYYFNAFIATQNDKMQTAIEAFDEIINDMPRSQAAFDIAKNALISRLRTQRTIGRDVLNAYVSCRDLGLSEPLEKDLYEKVQTMTLDDVCAAQQKWVKDRTYTYGILGSIEDLDVDYLKTLGPVKTLSLEDIFGY